jgi:hypothetical protein
VAADADMDATLPHVQKTAQIIAGAVGVIEVMTLVRPIVAAIHLTFNNERDRSGQHLTERRVR